MFVIDANRRWTIEQVAAVAPSPRSMSAAESTASPAQWGGLGADDSSVWGRCRGSGAEPYDTMVDHVAVAWRCTCPSRKLPCKHSLALLVLWVRGQVPEASAPAPVAAWTERRNRHPTAGRTGPRDDDRAEGTADSDRPGTPSGSDTGQADESAEPPPDRLDLDRSRDERVARMMAGLIELERWIDDRLRTGLSDPSLAQYATWDSLAARLVDAARAHLPIVFGGSRVSSAPARRGTTTCWPSWGCCT